MPEPHKQKKLWAKTSNFGKISIKRYFWQGFLRLRHITITTKLQILLALIKCIIHVWYYCYITISNQFKFVKNHRCVSPSSDYIARLCNVIPGCEIYKFLLRLPFFWTYVITLSYHLTTQLKCGTLVTCNHWGTWILVIVQIDVGNIVCYIYIRNSWFS